MEVLSGALPEGREVRKKKLENNMEGPESKSLVFANPEDPRGLSESCHWFSEP